MPRRALRSSPTKYATDLTDAQWAAIAPLVATPSPNGGRPTDIDRRAIVNALRSNHRTGRQWRMRPNDVPPMSSVRSYFDKWNRDGTYYTTMPAPPPFASRGAPLLSGATSIGISVSRSSRVTMSPLIQCRQVRGRGLPTMIRCTPCSWA